MDWPPCNATAEELMAFWQSMHEKNDNEIVEIENRCLDDNLKVRLYPSFSKALKLLCQAVENETFRKPISVTVLGKSGKRAVLDAVEKNRLFNIQKLNFFQDLKDVDGYQYEYEWLSRCIQSGKLQNLDFIDVTGVEEKVDAVLLALATGKAPHLKEIVVWGDFDAATEQTFVGAILDQKLAKLGALDCFNLRLKDHLGILRVPQEFADKDDKDILAFLRERWDYGEVQLSTAKVILTGPTTVGKTCLVNCLKGNKFSPDPGSTNTMEIGKTEDGGFVLFYHDFAGQDIYALARSIFAQSSAVYMVVWDRDIGTGGDEAPHQFARDVLDVNPNAKFIFVTTKRDLEGRQPLTVSEQEELKEQYGDLFLGYYHVSAQSGMGVDELRTAIKSAASFANVLMPRTYDELRKSLEGLRDGKWYIARDEWDALCGRVKISGDERISLALSLFQAMGEVVVLSSEHVVVRPSVLVGVLSRVVTVDEKYKDNARGGYLRHDELEQVWTEYPMELRKGFLDLIHDCDIGFPISDENQAYNATLIPPMMVESSGEEIRRGLEQLLFDFPDFKVGCQIIVDLSSLSNHLWIKLLVKLRGVVVLGGWSPRGCLVVDVDKKGDARIVRSFGFVTWDSMDHQISLRTVGHNSSSGQLLRLRVLNSLRATLKDFPGVRIESLRLTSFPDDTWSKEWSREELFHSILDKPSLEKLDAPDVVEWILKLQDDVETGFSEWANEESAFGYFLTMLREESSASDELLSYLLLSHQKNMLKKGCEHGRLDLNALWLIYDVTGSRMAYPLCPHLHPGKVRVNEELEVFGVSAVDLRELSSEYISVRNLVGRVLARLHIPPPRYEAEFLGILWHGPDEEYVYNVHTKSRSKFQPVRVDGFDVFIHESDQLFFTSESQVQAIEELTKKVKESIVEMRMVPAIGGECAWIDGNEAWRVRDGQCQLIQESNEDDPWFARDVTFVIYVGVFFVLFALVLKMKKTSSKLRRLRENESTTSHSHLAHAERLQAIDARTRSNPESSVDESEARRFQDDSFGWLRECFEDKSNRTQHMESVLFHTPINAYIANTVKSRIRDRIREECRDFHLFYPDIIISYSTGYRKDYDLVDSAGPGLMVAVALINFLFDQGHPCYSDIITPAGRDWGEYMLRLARAKVMVLLITDTFCRSVNCLEEVYEADKHGVELIPVRLEEKSVNGIDITRDTDAMWPDEELEKYVEGKKNAQSLLDKLKHQRFRARNLLSRVASLPGYGTILSEPEATDELVKRLLELANR